MADVFEGYNGRVELHDDALVVRRRGVASAVRGLSSEPRRVPLDSVTDVELHPATRLRNGWLRIAVDGKPLAPVRRPDPYDPDTVLFLYRSRHDFALLHERLVRVVERNRGREPGARPRPDVAEQIRKLADLHAAGVLTDAELEEKTRALLGRD